jgi:hypothetical protein
MLKSGEIMEDVDTEAAVDKRSLETFAFHSQDPLSWYNSTASCSLTMHHMEREDSRYLSTAYPTLTPSCQQATFISAQIYAFPPLLRELPRRGRCHKREELS